MYWVQPINQQQQQEYGEFNTFNILYKDLRNNPDWFYTNYEMNTEQFVYILSQNWTFDI